MTMKVTIYRYPHPTDVGRWLYTGQTIDSITRDRHHRFGHTSFGRRFKSTFPNVELPQPEVIELEVSTFLDANEEETISIFKNRTWHGQGGMNLTLPGSIDYVNNGILGGRTSAQLLGHHSRAGKIGGRATAATTNGRKANGGFISGRLAAECGRLVAIAAKGGRANQKKYGCRLTKNDCSKGSFLTGLSNGRAAFENKTGIHAPEFSHSDAGKKSVASKKGIHAVGFDKAIGGRLAAKTNIASGQFARIAAIGRQTALHKRWHVNRDKPNPSCVSCSEQSLIIAFA